MSTQPTLTEIIQVAESNGDNLTELLQFNTDQLEPDCLKRALRAAVLNDNPINVGKLIVKGADNIDECLKLSKDNRKPHARAMLLLVKSARDGNCILVLKLFNLPSPGLQDAHEYEDEGFPDVQMAVINGNVSTAIPIEIARRYNNAAVREELLLRTDVNQEQGSVDWHGLKLRGLDISWLRKIHWVKKLSLARNGFRQLPNEITTYLKQVHLVLLYSKERQSVQLEYLQFELGIH